MSQAFNPSQANLLLLGPPDSCKRTLARKIVELNDAKLEVYVGTAEELGDVTSDSHKWDVICLMGSITSPQSIPFFTQTLAKIDPAHLVSRTIVVLTKVDVAGPKRVMEINEALHKIQELIPSRPLQLSRSNISYTAECVRMAVGLNAPASLSGATGIGAALQARAALLDVVPALNS